MTEIPEHLLKRSQERRKAMGGGGDDAASDAPADGAGESTAVAKPAAAAPAPAAAAAPAPPPPPKPDPPYVAAAKGRKKVPFWAAPVLALLVPWAFLYYNAVQKPPAGENDPLTIGRTVYSGNCSGCHGPTGGGGTGPALNGGDAVKTFKNPLSMVHWIAFGADGGGARADGTYGDKDRPGGVHKKSTYTAAMPPWKDSLTPEELAAVVIYVREELDGAKPTDPAEKDFNPEVFDTLADVVTQVIDLGPGGDPDLSKVKTAG